MTEEVKDYRIEVKVKNNNLLRRIEDAGYKTVAEFCKMNNHPNWQSKIGDLINLKATPFNAAGKFNRVVVGVAEILKCLPEDLFTETQMNTALESNKKYIETSEAEMRFMLENQKEVKSLEDLTEFNRLPEKVSELLETLTPREAKVIALRFGLKGMDTHTLEECSQTFGCNRERIRQIEAKALRKLRHPSRSEVLKETYYD